MLSPDLATNLNDPGAFANPAMADNTGSQVRPGEDLSQNLFHLSNIHINLN
jgi:hypothetical protein